jgi:hypothetical protein
MPSSSAQSDELLDLIHSLDASEKRHFSLFAQRHTLGDGNHYALLFSWMDAQATYNAPSLEARMKSHGIATPLAAAKNHLKTLLLRALREYRSGQDAHTRLLEGLGNLAIFWEKKQYGLLQKEIKRLKKMALLYGEHHVLFKIGDFERRLHKETAHRGIAEGMEAILAEVQAITASFQNQMEMTHLLDRFFLIAKMSAHDRGLELEALLRHPLLSHPSQAQTLHSRIYFHQIHAIAHQLRGQNPAAMQHYATVVKLWEGAPHLIRESPSTYRRILVNYLGICHLLDEYAPFPDLLSQIRNSPCASMADRAEVFNFSHYFELLWRMGTYDWEVVARLLPEIQKGLREYEDFLDQGWVLSFIGNAALYLFLAQNYRSCRLWLREITDAPRGEQRMDIQRLARLLTLLCTWAVDDLDLLEYQLKAAQRYFEKWGEGALEASVLSLVRDLLAAVDRPDQTLALATFIETIQLPSTHSALGATELRAWATAQIRSAKPLDILRAAAH